MTRASSAVGEFIITNELGLHFRAAAMVVRTAGRFDCRVTISNGSSKAVATSVLDLLTLAATCGTKVVVRAEGPEAKIAVEALGSLIERQFAE